MTNLQNQTETRQSETHVTLVAKNLWSGQIDTFDEYLTEPSDPSKSLYRMLCDKHNVCQSSHETIDFIVWPV
jgi:hypothetical protein